MNKLGGNASRSLWITWPHTIQAGAAVELQRSRACWYARYICNMRGTGKKKKKKDKAELYSCDWSQHVFCNYD